MTGAARAVYPVGMEQAERELDRRTTRTRKAICDALTRLIFTRRYTSIRTAELIAEADVGRSTFYEHFRSKDDVLIAVIDPIFAPLAQAATGQGSDASLTFTLEHLWEQRGMARMLFEPGLLSKLQRKLAGMIEARMPVQAEDHAPNAMVAMGVATGQLAILRVWLTGEVACPARTLARHLRREMA